jgi:dipeptidyl aminopeptidase/acylaminoacyl peptidase
MIRHTQHGVVAVLACLAFVAPLAPAQIAAPQQGWNPQEILQTETYVRPPAVVERIIMTPRTDISFPSPSPDRKWFLRAVIPDRGDIRQYGKPHIYLAGIQVDTEANRARLLTIRGNTGLTIVDPRTMATRAIALPKGATASSQTWSSSGAQIAYIANFDNASHLVVADVATGKAVQVTRTPLLATLVTSTGWTADGKSIVAVLVPEGRGPVPTHGKNGIEDGPTVRLTQSKVIQQVIHPSLLDDPHDKALLKFYTTGQLALIDVKTKAVRKIGAPAMIRSVDVSSDGQYFLVTQMQEPFSYRVPASNFASVQELWDASGKVVATLNKTPLREGEAGGDADVPAGGRGGPQSSPSDTGKRNIQWNPVGPGLVFMQSIFAAGGRDSAAPAGRAGRGGNAGGRGAQQRPQPTSVRYVNWLPPFGPNDTRVLYEGSGRLTSVAWSANAKTMFASDSGTVLAIRAADPSKRYNLGRGVILAAGGGGFGGRGGGVGGGADTSATGGTLAMKRGANGAQFVVVGADDKTVFLSGTRTPGANWPTQAPRPWTDKLDFESGQRARIFDSPADAYEQMVAPLDDDYSQYIYTHETPTVITDAYLRDVKAGSSRKLTDNKDVMPEVTGAQHKRFQVARPRDGFRMWVDITLPRNWQPGTRLPGIIWFYPREYMAQAEYDRSRYTTNINAFPDIPSARPASMTRLWVTQGYAVIEPDIPIVGDSGRMNDNYTRDLRENLDAVLDAVVEAGYVDRTHMGIGGHSYGAFSTVNAMTLVPYFKAGIAGDGMYNRSLTPYGFQSERRNFFEAQDTYLDMSPFYRADKLSGALLMYHSIEDQNVGTAPISSIRMLHALQGLGKTAALFMYPYEDHSVGTYQTDLDQWARWFAWFDVYVKNAKPEQKAATVPQH